MNRLLNIAFRLAKVAFFNSFAERKTTMKDRTMLSAVLGCTLLVSTTMLTAGCSGLPGKGFPSKDDIARKMPWSKDKGKPKPYPNPARMASTWTPDTLTQTGRTPTRGFGGRLFFYDEKTKAVAVDGELTVHAFAENADGSQGEIKRYHFTPEQFTNHFSQTDIGASYSVWIPWDAVGGDQTKVSLVPSFRAANGRLVQGEQALVGLPGKRPHGENVAVRPTAASILEAKKDNAKVGMVTTTIPVRGSMSRNLSPLRSLPESRALPGTMPLPQVEAIAAFGPAEIPVPVQTEGVVNANAQLAVGGSSLTRSEFGSSSFANKLTAQRPLRLGQSGFDSGKPVVRASATSPLIPTERQ